MSGGPEAEPIFARIVVGLPVPRVFTYTVPTRLATGVGTGQRVRVPFQGRPRPGVVVGFTETAPERVQEIEALLDPVPALTPTLLELCRWAAEQTVSAWGEAVARALPPPARAPAPAVVPPAAPSRRPPHLVVGYGAGRALVVEAVVRRAVDGGSGVLLLAPEIETARGWAATLARLVGGECALVTSEESPRRRWATWWAARTGQLRVAVGTRAAAFLPIACLGAVVVVDEHDPAHKALDAPRWHARELAIRRSRLEGGVCLVTSGAPSLESWSRLSSGQATGEEAKAGGWPAVHRVDLRPLPDTACLAPALRAAVRETLTDGRSVVLLLNRLGYGRALGCPECGAVRRCSRCRVALIYHLGARVLACRLCGGRQPAGSQCGRCRGRRLRALGWGTERLEAEARALFPAVRVARYDGEVSAATGAAIRAAFRTGAVRLLVGTQMAARLCADVPVGLAALVLADSTLHLPDFRAAERTFQLAWHLAEAVAPGGSLWIQSFYPDHPALQAVADGEREVFYRREWADRQELGFPPARRMARIILEGGEARPRAAQLAAEGRASGLTVLGPVPMAAGRAQLVFQGDDELPQTVARVLAPLRGRRRLGATRLLVDVDPVELP